MRSRRRFRGVVAFQAGRPPVLRDDLELRPMRDDEVRVEIATSGICHSDVGVATGAMVHQPLPVVLGHEGAGVVAETGRDVTDVQVGERVVLTLPPPPCGRCDVCAQGRLSHCRNRGVDNGPVFRLGDSPAYSMFRIGTLVEQTLVPASRVVPVADLPMEQACLLGCGVTTAFGAVLNTARVTPGSTVLVIGCGGVGMGIIEAARAAGARAVVAVDTNETKLLAARNFGATHVSRPDQLEAVRRSATDTRGFDYGFEVTGRPSAFDQMMRSLARDGLGVLVGIPPVGESFSITNEFMFSGRRIAASFIGDGNPSVDIPRYVTMQRAGAVDFAKLVSSVVTLDGAVQALTALTEGDTAAIRTVVAVAG